MDIETAGDVCYELGLESSWFSTSQFANRARILGWGETAIIELLQSVPGVRRVSHSWWRLQPSELWRTVRKLGVALLVALVLSRLLV